jgi:hypothetical protein
MAIKTHVPELLAGIGITNADYQHDSRDAYHISAWHEIGRQEATGRITPALASDARRALIEDAIEHLANDPVKFRQARDNGTFDQYRALANRYESDDISSEALSRKRQDALDTVLALTADERFADGRLNALEYGEIIKRTDPNAFDDGRRRAGYDQVAQGSLDGEMRALDADEAATAGTAAFFHRQGLTTDRPDTTSRPDDAQESVSERASDWSEDRLQKYFDLRSAEREAAANPHEHETREAQSQRRSITSGSAAFYNPATDE